MVSRYHYHASREIAAPADEVWAVLADLDRYAEWNPFTPHVETTRAAGQPIVLYVDFALHQPPLERGKLLRQVETIHRFAPGDALCWTAKLLHPRVFYGERWQRVEALDDRRCRYTTEEQFSGPLAWLVDRLYGTKVQRGFEAVADALARRFESR